MRSVLVPLAFILTLGACASIDEAYGRPDALEWTYFHGSPDGVADAIGAAMVGGPNLGQRLAETDSRREPSLMDGYHVASVQSVEAGLVLTITPRRGSAEATEILVQETDVEGFTARAQLYPQGRPLPRWLEIEINGRI